jgi:hypothetical protein
MWNEARATTQPPPNNCKRTPFPVSAHRSFVRNLASLGPAWLMGAIMTLAVSSASMATPFDDGVVAAQRGDLSTAATLYRQAADQGDSRAEFVLGVMYANGQGVAQNASEAARWYEKAADQGEAGAQYSLGALYRDGTGVPQDTQKAAYWFGRAAAPDQSIAQSETSDPSGLKPLPRISLSSFGAPGVPDPEFRTLMNTVFGPGRWRETGGYRTPEREDELRAEGALTVPVGRLSSHSLGTPDAPGAYDIVVDGLTPAAAADILWRSGFKFRRVFPESTHGAQGPHLHIEPSPLVQPGLTQAQTSAGPDRAHLQLSSASSLDR